MTATRTPDRPASAALTVADRCDRCGAQAFVRVHFVAGELTFCGHHARAMSAALQAQAVRIEDGSHAINSRPSPSANAD